MTVNELIEQVTNFHASWKKRPKPRRGPSFKATMMKEKRDLFQELRRQAHLMPRLPTRVREDWQRARRDAVTSRDLQALMPAIMALYSREGHGRNLKDFINGLLEKHPTRDRLRGYLANQGR